MTNHQQIILPALTHIFCNNQPIINASQSPSCFCTRQRFDPSSATAPGVLPFSFTSCANITNVSYVYGQGCVSQGCPLGQRPYITSVPGAQTLVPSAVCHFDSGNFQFANVVSLYETICQGACVRACVSVLWVCVCVRVCVCLCVSV